MTDYYRKDIKRIIEREEQKKKYRRQIKVLSALEGIIIFIVLVLLGIMAYNYFISDGPAAGIIPNVVDKVQAQNI